MTTILRRKLRRDLWRQRWQFAAVAFVIAIGVSVFVGSTDAYRNLGDSFDRAYATQRLPDVILSGTGAADLRSTVRQLPGDAAIEVRDQGDLGIRVRGHTVLGRAVGVPAGRQPAVSLLALRSGALPVAGEVVVEEHLAEHYHLRPGDTLELLSPEGWRPVRVAGSALSTEYFWPARSPQEVMTTPEHFGVVFMPESDVRSLVADPVEQLVVHARDRDRAAVLVDETTRLGRADGLEVATRDDQPSYQALADDVDAIGTFARLLPWLFLSAAVLGTYVLLSRLVAAQRAVIGTLAANGVAPRSLRRHYLGYGAAVGVVGAAPGLVGGYALGAWITTEYTDALGLPLHVTSVHPTTLLVAAAVATAAAGLAAWAPARTAAATSPAEAMRFTVTGGPGRRSVLERLVPVVGRAPARWRMTLRGMGRNRRRSVLTVLGVAVSAVLIMVFAGLRDTVANVVDRQYSTVQLEDAEVATTPTATPRVLTRVGDDPGVARAEPYGRYDVMAEAGDTAFGTLLVALDPATQMHRFLSGGKELRLPDDGVLLGQGARETLGVETGDRVVLTIPGTGQRLEQPVAGFVDEPMNPVVYMSSGLLTKLTGLPPTGVMVRLRPGADEADVSARVTAIPGVAGYLSTATLAEAMREAFSLYDALVGLMLVFGALMAAALLYNAMSANVAERSVELGTLQAAGMGAGQLGRLAAAENLFLVAIGLPLGLGLGTLAATWLMATYETQGYHWNLDLSAGTPFLVGGGVLVAALAAQLPVVRAVRRMDLARIVRERSL